MNRIALLALLVPTVASAVPVQSLVGRVWLDPRIGEVLPADLPLLDYAGRSAHLGDFRGRPMLLALVSYRCPNMCDQMLMHLVEGLNGVGPTAGRAFHVVTVSFDPRDTSADAAHSRLRCLRAYRHAADAEWNSMIAPSASIQRLEKAVNFRAEWDPAHQSYSHALGVLVITPTGRISHCFNSADFSPADLASALADANRERLTPVANPVQEYCATYDLAGTAVGRNVIRWLRVGGVLTVLLLLGYIGVSIYREHRRVVVPGQEVRP